MNAKKIFSYIAAFFAGIFSVILTVLFNNRRRDTDIRADTNRTEDAYRRLDSRVEASKSSYARAAEIFKKVRARKFDTENNNTSSSNNDSNNNI